jgi:hypothetical protein
VFQSKELSASPHPSPVPKSFRKTLFKKTPPPEKLAGGGFFTDKAVAELTKVLLQTPR